MISEKDREKTHDFLMIETVQPSIIINREQVATGLSLPDLFPMASSSPYLTSWGKAGGERIPLFDLDRSLEEVFTAQGPKSGLRVGLITEVAHFHPRNRNRWEKILSNCPERLSGDRVGFLVDSRIDIVEIPIREVRPLPVNLKPRYREEGIIGCRFYPSDRLALWIDLERLLFIQA